MLACIVWHQLTLKMYQVTCKILTVFLTISSISGYNDLPEINQQVCVEKLDGEKVSVPESCTHYYHCESQLGYLIDCSDFGDYRFDRNVGQCNFAYAVQDCTDSFSHNQPLPIKPSQNYEFDGKVSINAPEYDTIICRGHQNYVTFGVRGSCTLFYTCLDDVAYLDDCSLMGTFQFDAKIGQCNLKNTVRCNDSDEIVRSPYRF